MPAFLIHTVHPLATTRGLNPDAPAHLRKVTETV
jgi:hypothetical protein